MQNFRYLTPLKVVLLACLADKTSSVHEFIAHIIVDNDAMSHKNLIGVVYNDFRVFKIVNVSVVFYCVTESREFDKSMDLSESC